MTVGPTEGSALVTGFSDEGPMASVSTLLSGGAAVAVLVSAFDVDVSAMGAAGGDVSVADATETGSVACADGCVGSTEAMGCEASAAGAETSCDGWSTLGEAAAVALGWRLSISSGGEVMEGSPGAAVEGLSAEVDIAGEGERR